MTLSPPLTRFIENLAQYFESFGIPRIGGRILGLLLVSSEPLSAEAISTILKVSRASVSTNIRFALQVGLAEKVSFPGDRITYYAFPETGLEKTLAVEIQAVSIMKRFVEQGLNALSPEDGARSRLEALDDWADFLLQVWQKALIEWQERQQAQSAVQKTN
jgi:DNA-binding transcriptional regulator GbsR (MarR family)